MKLKLNLSLTAKLAQRWAPSAKTATPLLPALPVRPVTNCVARKELPLKLLTDNSRKPVRIPPPPIVARPVFRGNKSYLRALRAAEMAAWHSNRSFPTF